MLTKSSLGDIENSNVDPQKKVYNFFSDIFVNQSSPAKYLANSIAELYTDGIESLMNTNSPNSNEAYVILIFNCPIEFYNKYSNNEDNGKMKGLGLFSGLVSSENLNLGVGIEDEDYEFNVAKKTEEINQKIEVTNKFRRLITDLFENFDAVAEELIETILEKQSQNKANQIKKGHEEYYSKMNELYQKITNNYEGFYYYFNYSDFILIFSRILNYYLNLNIKLEFTDYPTVFLLSIYGNEEQLRRLAQYNEYELKLKPYALKYQYYLEHLNELTKLKTIKESVEQLPTADNIIKDEPLVSTERKDELIDMNNGIHQWEALKYSELDKNNVLHWPPYHEYNYDKNEKFQRYEPDDTYHECNIGPGTDDICKKCSVFRNIDKLRTIYDSVDKMIKINYMVQEKILNFIMLKRNHVNYADKVSYKGILKKPWNVFDKKEQMDHIFTIRNFYGETVAYYFVWLADYVRWLLLPASIGLFIFLLSRLIKRENEESNMAYNIFMIIYCSFIALWATLFLSQWKKKEKIYNYFWGTENYKKLEPDSESFIPDGNKELIFNVKFPYVNKMKTLFKYFVSYTVLVLMLFITISGVLFWFYLKLLWLNAAKDYEGYNEETKFYYQKAISMAIASANAIQIKILNFIYTKMATALNSWENHQKDYQSTNFLATKLILFDFVNSFSPIYYIAFFKSNGGIESLFVDNCIEVGCIKEIETQLYTTLAINFSINFVEIGLPLFKYYVHKKTLEKLKEQHKIENSVILESDNKFEIIPHTIEHQLISVPYDHLIGEYSEVLILFGYVCQFSVAAPLTPLIAFCLLYVEKFVDTLKMFFLVRMNIIDGSTGLEIYNQIMQALIYVGLLVNFAIITFADTKFFGVKADASDIEKKKNLLLRVVIYASIEIFMFIVCQAAWWNVYPAWLKYKSEIKDLYQKKYYSREERLLPHYNLLENIKKKKRESEKAPLKLSIFSTNV